MTLDEIYRVKKEGYDNKFGDDIDAENIWLARALEHALAMLDVAQTYVRECQNEWRDLEA